MHGLLEDVLKAATIAVAVFGIYAIWSTDSKPELKQPSQQVKLQDTYTPTTTTSPQEEQYYKGYRCTEDCSGHEAGYEWAEDNDVCDGYEESHSDSFNEGVEAYIDENC